MQVPTIHASRVNVTPETKLFVFGFNKANSISGLDLIEEVSTDQIQSKSSHGIFLVDSNHESEFAKHAPSNVKAISISLDGKSPFPTDENVEIFRHFISPDNITDFMFLQRLQQCSDVFFRQDQINEIDPATLKTIEDLAALLSTLPKPFTVDDREHIITCNPCQEETSQELAFRKQIGEAMRNVPGLSLGEDFVERVLASIGTR